MNHIIYDSSKEIMKTKLFDKHTDAAFNSLEWEKESMVEAGSCKTVIAEGINITGEITGTNNIKIDGYIDGPITTDGAVIISETGKVNGIIKAKNVVIAGEIKGEILSDRLQITSTGKVLGNISVMTLEVESGGKFIGNSLSRESENKDTEDTEEIIEKDEEDKND